jgi:hypothetical protein
MTILHSQILVKILGSVYELSLVLACLLMLYLRTVFRRNPRHVSFAQKLQGPPGWPLIGHSLDFWHGGAGKFLINLY